MTIDRDSATGGPAAEPSAPAPSARYALFFSEIRDFEARSASDPEAATKAATLMQQILGESVYLYDGKVVDPFGPRLVATLPSARAAIDAALKARSDLLEFNHRVVRPEQRIEPTIVIHLRDREDDASPGLTAFDIVRAAAAAAPPCEIVVSRPALDDAGATADPDLFGTFGEVEFFVKKRPDPKPEVRPQVAGSKEAASPASVPEAGDAGRKRRMIAIAAGAALVVVIAGVAGSMFWSGQKERARAAAEAKRAADLQSAREAERALAAMRRIHVTPFTSESSSATSRSAAEEVRTALIELLRSLPQVSLHDQPGEAGVVITADIKEGMAGFELIAGLAFGENRDESEPFLLLDPADTVAPLVSWVAQKLELPEREFRSADPAAWKDFLQAAVLHGNGDRSDDAKAAELIAAATAADPQFLPAHLLASRVHARSGNLAAAVAAARRASELDASNLTILRHLAALEREHGDSAGELATLARILALAPEDPDAIVGATRHALSSADEEAFGRLLERVTLAGIRPSPFHQPDLLLFGGKFDQAASLYFDIEVDDPNNPFLALRIGRLSILRRSLTIAELELKKLETLDPGYGHHLMRAYIAAEKKDRAGAEAALAEAAAGAAGRDELHTASAEVWAMLNEPKRALASLQTAFEKGEPTLAYVASNPLFNFIKSDPAYRELERRMAQRRRSIASALAGIE